MGVQHCPAITFSLTNLFFFYAISDLFFYLQNFLHLNIQKITLPQISLRYDIFVNHLLSCYQEKICVFLTKVPSFLPFQIYPFDYFICSQVSAISDSPLNQPRIPSAWGCYIVTRERNTLEAMQGTGVPLSPIL